MNVASTSVAHPENSPNEMVEEVSPTGEVVRLVSRAQMRAERLWHRSVFLAVVNDDGDLLVHRRALTKDVWPGWWDVAVGGVVAPGEEWDVAVRRELSEELGVNDAQITRLSSGAYMDDAVAIVAHCYLARCNGPFTFADGEITEAHWVTPAELPVWLSAKPFLPDSVALVLPHLDGFSVKRP